MPFLKYVLSYAAKSKYMDLLNEMVLLMDKHAARQYKLYSGTENDDSQRKDFYLFDNIRRLGENYDDEKTFK